MTKVIDQIKALQLENKKLKEEAKMLTGWISMLSHNNTEIFGSLKWVIDAYEKEIISVDDFFKLLPQIKNDVTKHLQTTRDTRDWLRTQFGNFTPQQNTINSLALFNQLKEEHKEALEKKQIIYEYIGDPTLSFISDKILLFIILSKITHNAIKFSNNKQSIQFIVSKNDDAIKISIKDFGIGISESHLKSIYSFDSPVFEGTDGELGAGLSLKIVKYFVFLLKGRMEIKSLENKGTTVAISLPLD